MKINKHLLLNMIRDGIKTVMTAPNDEGALDYFVLYTTYWWGDKKTTATTFFSATPEGGLVRVIEGPVIVAEIPWLKDRLFLRHLRESSAYQSRGYTPSTKRMIYGNLR